MEKLSSQLMKIIAEQDEELEKFRKDNFYYDQWTQVEKEKQSLKNEIELLIKKINILGTQNQRDIKTVLPDTPCKTTEVQ